MCEEFVPGGTELVELAAVAFFNLFCFLSVLDWLALEQSYWCFLVLGC